jgi:hypothetical protein
MKDELEHLEDEGWHLRCGGTGSELDVRVEGEWRLSLSTRTRVPDATPA